MRSVFKEEITEKDERINALEQQLRAMQNPEVPSTANQEASAKVDRNDLADDSSKLHGCAVDPPGEEVHPNKRL